MTVETAVLSVSKDSDELAQLRMSANKMAELINEKAWGLLGLTAQEFTRAWYAGEYAGSTYPVMVAMDGLMRTGRWDGPAEAVSA